MKFRSCNIGTIALDLTAVKYHIRNLFTEGLTGCGKYDLGVELISNWV
jgi:hypothetical protein